MRWLDQSFIRTAWFLLWCLSWPVITLLLLKPLPFPLPSRSDLLGHFLLFGAMSASVILFARHRVQILILTAVTILLSLGLEAAQAFVPHRLAEWPDALANMTGGLAGGFFALLIVRRFFEKSARSAVM